MVTNISEPKQVNSEVVVNKAKELLGRLVTEKHYTEHFDRQTLESGTISSGQEQSDNSDYWDESSITDKNTVVENSLIPENSVLMRLGKLLTESEKVLIDEFHSTGQKNLSNQEETLQFKFLAVFKYNCTGGAFAVITEFFTGAISARFIAWFWEERSNH